jgi:hypothetical protein
VSKGANHDPADDPFDPDDLESVRRRTVDPVVWSVLQGHEIDEVAVWEVPRPRSTEESWLGFPDREVWIRVRSQGETFEGPLWGYMLGDDRPPPIGVIAERLASLLEDWVCNTRFAWGQRRQADYEIPPA